MAYNPVNPKFNKPIYDTESVEILSLKDIPEYNIPDFADLDNPKVFKKYLEEIEALCRKSSEYGMLMSYLRDYMEMDTCAFLNVSNRENKKIKIEIHHHPITLLEIVMIVFEKRKSCGESLETEQVAKEVMYLHYLCLVGLIPLSSTLHEAVHSGAFQIPINLVFGDYKKFIEMYSDYIDPELKSKFNNLMEYDVDLEKELEFLKTSVMTIEMDADGMKKISNSDLLNLLEQRMNFNLLSGSFVK